MRTHNPWLWLLFWTAFGSSLLGLLLSVTWKPEGNRYVRPHEASNRLRVRLAGPLWPVLPGVLQGLLCGCPVCRGEEGD